MALSDDDVREILRIIDESTLAALNDRRAARGLPSFAACIDELLENSGEPGA